MLDIFYDQNKFAVTETNSDTDFVFAMLRESNKAQADALLDKWTKLQAYVKLIENPSDITDPYQRLQMFGKLSIGFRLASEALALALTLRSKSESDRKAAESIAAIDEYSDFVASKDGQKSTEELRKRYVYTSPNVRKAAQFEASMEGIVTIFAALKTEFMLGISTLKAIMYGPKESSYLSSSATGEIT